MNNYEKIVENIKLRKENSIMENTPKTPIKVPEALAKKQLELQELQLDKAIKEHQILIKKLDDEDAKQKVFNLAYPKK